MKITFFHGPFFFLCLLNKTQVCFMHQDPTTNSMLLATFDGHGQYGHLVSRYFQRKFFLHNIFYLLVKYMFIFKSVLCTKLHLKKIIFFLYYLFFFIPKGHLCESVVQHPSWVNDPAKAMRDCMLAREQELCQGRGVDTSLSGTTAVFALVRKDELTVLNAGDSRLMLGVRDARTGKVVPREVTIDNKPDDPKEQARIEAHGGRVWAMKYDDGVDGVFVFVSLKKMIVWTGCLYPSNIFIYIYT